MKLNNAAGEFVNIQFTISELIAINNALNEFCNGIEIKDFENRIGMSISDAGTLLSAIG